MVFIAAAFFIFSLTILTPAQFDAMWKATILASECGHFFFLIGIVFLIFATFRQVRFYKITSLLLIGGCAIFISPLLTLSSHKDVSWKLTDLLPSSEDFTQKDFIYKEFDGKPFSLTLYENKNLLNHCGSNCPVIITIHGGSWHGGSRDDLESFNVKFLDLGYKVIAISYRLAPKYLFPAALDDTLDAISYVKQHHRDLGVNPDKIILHGRSAGGHLALLASMTMTANKQSPLAVIAFYPITDFVWGYQNSLPSHIVDGHFVLPEFTGKTLDQDRALYEKASPVYQVKERLPPILLVHGIRDELVSIHHSQALMSKLREHHDLATLIPIPWATHAFDYFPSGPGSIWTFSEIKIFLNSLK